MKNAMTKQDLPAVRAAAAKIPMENLVVDKWGLISKELGKVPTEQSIFDLKVVLFMSAKMLRILAEDINFRGVQSSLEAIDKVEKIKESAEALLVSLKQDISLGKY